MPKTFSISRSFAIHEAGKALVATVLRLTRERQGLKPRLERVERVSMVPRGRRAPRGTSHACPLMASLPGILTMSWNRPTKAAEVPAKNPKMPVTPAFLAWHAVRMRKHLCAGTGRGPSSCGALTRTTPCPPRAAC